MTETLGEKNSFKKAKERETFEETRSVNCNICRNFANIFDRSHRLSISHQNKLSQRFRIIKSEINVIRYHSIAVHDDQWGKEEELWCYFCDKSVKKHQVYEGCTIEYLGYLTHLTNYQHFKAVKSYLKYNYREDKIEWFCKTQEYFKKFMNKLPEAKKRYLAKLNFIHQKNVAHIKEVEEERRLVNEALQVSVNRNEATISATEGSTQQINKLHQNISVKQIDNLHRKPKICPWLLQSDKKCNDQGVLEKPVIGPTIDTLKRHVADQKKKKLPIKRLGTNFDPKQVGSSHWLPSFSGVWNKGRHKQIKLNKQTT